MSVNLDKCVTKDEDDTWAVQCPVTDGSCGDKEVGVGFRSTGWPTKKVARARLDEHVDDHKGVAPMSSLDEFRDRHGLHPTADGKRAVTAKDLS